MFTQKWIYTLHILSAKVLTLQTNEHIGVYKINFYTYISFKSCFVSKLESLTHPWIYLKNSTQNVQL
jgi:uncharacterized membrane protein YcgQ (UPF0703/DUF1980 family)